MTLMTHGNSRGSRRCTARCYNASGKRCECICGGMNHRQGFARARRNVQNYGEQLLAQIADRERQEEKAIGQVFMFEGEKV